MTAIEELIERINRLEERFKKDKYADAWLIPRDLLIRVRDELKKDEE